MENGILYYFKNQEQMTMASVSPKVAINLRDCLVEDFEPATPQMASKKNTQKLDNNEPASLLIRIMHRVRRRRRARSGQ